MPKGRLFHLRDLRPDEREKILAKVLQQRLLRWEAAGRDQLEDALSLAEQFRGLGLPLPAGLDEETSLSLAHALADAARSFAQGGRGAIAEIKAIAARAKTAGVGVSGARAEESFARGVDRLLAKLEDGASGELIGAVEAADAARFGDWRAGAQVRVFRWLKSHPEAPDAARLAELLRLKP